MQALIAITAGEVVDFTTGHTWTPMLYGQFRTYTDAVVRAGGVPFLVPLIDEQAALRRLYEQCDGLLLSGGHDLAPASYKAKARSQQHVKIKPSARRDKQELQLLKWALADDKPVLGICRGMQLINVALGGNLHQHIGDDLPAAGNHTLNIDKEDFQHLAHHLTIAPDSRLAAILDKPEIAANSLHHQAVDTLGSGLVVTARAEDGVIEAVELPDKRFVIGVQSHPEALENGAEPAWQKLFAAFVDSAARA